ncbi:ceramide phosphoethanolamine synthase-like [Physella acuta]|uniref:ceramide phosphoethanolamine synthase-like n=1 Tax=Physella acuta TaxID=109671 RepID=UPI0027DB1BD9|nr:ceramide phosphoethanolamine synthase-like [Physella acuta]
MLDQAGDYRKLHLRLDGHKWSLCPCPELTAYWTPPPSWPRRILCESKYFSGSLTKNCWIILVTLLLTYFFIMDVFLFDRFRTADLVKDSRAGSPDEIYTPFTHLSIKGLLNDHPSQFIIAPSTEYFELLTHFSSVFYFISPNMISAAHLICGFLSGKLMSSDHLYDRRIGVVLFEFRTWLDAFDGTVHRAQAGLHLQYHSNHSTSGYIIDSTFDTLGGCFLSFGIFFYLLKRFRSPKSPPPAWPKQENSIEVGVEEPVRTCSDGYSVKYLFWKAFSFGLCLGVAAKGWDQAVEDFSQVFQVQLENPTKSLLQFNLCHSYSSIILFYLWRLFGGQSILNYILIAIYMDKTWEFLRYTQWILLGVASVLFAVTTLYIHHVKGLLLL